jgi:hypothetical protein
MSPPPTPLWFPSRSSPARSKKEHLPFPGIEGFETAKKLITLTFVIKVICSIDLLHPGWSHKSVMSLDKMDQLSPVPGT